MSEKVRPRAARRRRWGTVAAASLALGLLLASCSSGKKSAETTSAAPPASAGASGGASTAPAKPAGGTLTVDSSFDVQGLDPARSVTPTMTVATRGMYDTLLRTKGGSDTTPVPSVAKSFDASADAKTYTFHLRDDVTFADGSKLTSADVLFSFKRMAALKLGSSYMLDGITVTAPDAQTVVLTSEAANPAIPQTVTSPAFAILNSKMVKENGGTDGDDAPTADKTETWFNSHSAGSGPYVLESYKTNDSITLVRNDKYWGTPATFDKVVIRAMAAPTQLLNVQRGTNEIALNLSAAQSSTLANNSAVTVKTDASPSLVRLQTTMDPQASATGANPHIQQAIRYALNYDALVQLAGTGAAQAAGLLPAPMAGSVPSDKAIKQDVAKAKSELAASGISNPSLTLTYPSDINVNGIQFATFAQRIASDLQAVGITAKLEALPVATYLPKLRTGKMEMTLLYSYPDIYDPSSVVSYLPGGSDGVRTGWKKGADPTLEAAGAKLTSTVDAAERANEAVELQQKMTTDGPYMPLLQASQTVVSSQNLTNVALDPGWTIDVAAIGVK